jgi:hypothetical protein
MSLSKKQKIQTIREFEENVALTELTLEEIALEVGTNAANLEQIMQLACESFEDPWIVRNYLIEKLTDMGKEPIPFSALRGDHHDYWFLDTAKIDRKKID